MNTTTTTAATATLIAEPVREVRHRNWDGPRIAQTQRVRVIPHDGSAPWVNLVKFWRDGDGRLVLVTDERME